jgi:putative transposase
MFNLFACRGLPGAAASPELRRSDDLTNAEWAAVAPLLPFSTRTGRHRTTNLRQVVRAIRHHWRTGCPWRKLPPDCPPWSTVYIYFRRWRGDGTLRRIRPILDPSPGTGCRVSPQQK